MATNENVNKVIYGNQTVMDITDTTAEESDVASGEVFYKANGARSVGTLTLNKIGSISENDDLNNYYVTGEYNADTAKIVSTIINKPSDLTAAFQLRVINRGKTKDESLQIRTVTQIIECINNNDSDVIYKRTKSHNTSSWGPWYKFTGTVVS